MRTYTYNNSRTTNWNKNRTTANPMVDVTDIKATWWNAGGTYKVIIDSNLERGKTYKVSITRKNGGTDIRAVKVYSVKGFKSFASVL